MVAIRQWLAATISISTKRAIKRMLWSCGVGQLFRLLLDKPEAFARYFQRKQPSIMLYTSNLCNALCSFCAYPTNIDPKHSMANAVAFKAIDEFIAMAGPGDIDFTPNLGDPLVDPKLSDKLAYAKSKGVRSTHFHTNGILLDRPGLIEKISPHLDLLQISLPGLDRKNYLDVFKVDKAEKVTRGLIKLAEYKKRTGNPKKVTLEFRSSRPLAVVMRDEGMVKIKPYIEQGIFEMGSFYTEYDTYGGTIGKGDMLGLMKIKRSDLNRSVPCFALFTHHGILPDGHVRACACWYIKTNYDKLTLESVAEKPLRDILYGNGHRAIIADWTRGDLPPPCSKCSYYQPAFFGLVEIVGMAKELVGFAK